MVCPPILMECSVDEDSSFGGGGVGSPGFSFSTVLVSFSCTRSCAPAPSELMERAATAATAPRRSGFIMDCAPIKFLWNASARFYTAEEAQVKGAMPERESAPEGVEGAPAVRQPLHYSRIRIRLT